MAFHPFKKVKRLGSLKVIFVFFWGGGELLEKNPLKKSLVYKRLGGHFFNKIFTLGFLSDLNLIRIGFQTD